MYLYKHKEPQPRTRIAEALKWDYRKVAEHIKQMTYVGLIHANDNDDYCLSEYIRTCFLTANILERVKSGMVQDVCTISVTHSRPTLSTKDLQYGKVHKNGENERGAEIPSKLNCEYLKNKCGVCGRVPVGKDFELMYHRYEERIYKFCRGCYVRWFFSLETCGDGGTWEVLL
jgi:hypothetical protein